MTRFPLSATVAGIALLFTTAAPAQEAFDEAEVFIELNDTDGDLGFYALVDGETWKRLKIENPEGKKIFQLSLAREAAKQGFTELFFESAEPGFDEFPPEKFFERFAEGTYRIVGKSTESGSLVGNAEVTHLMPEAPSNVQVNGQLAPVDCDAEGPVQVDAPVTITWDDVTFSHSEIGRQPPEPVDIINYEVVVEIDDTPFKASTILPPSVTSFEVPSEILALGEEIKIEILAREESFNQTAFESCFET